MCVGLIFEFAGVFVVPIVFLAIGWLFTHGRYPKHPNEMYGYRTTRSMKNDETWAFAQEYWGHLSWRFGWWLLMLSSLVVVALLTLSVKRHEIYVGAWIAVQAVLTLATIIPVERALKNTFDEYGHRKSI